MQETVSFETALKLKKLGFSYMEDTMSEAFYEPNYMWYVNHRIKGYITVGSFAIDFTPEGHAQYFITEETPLIPAPSLGQVQDWLIENYNMCVHVIPFAPVWPRVNEKKILFNLDIISSDIERSRVYFSANGWSDGGPFVHYNFKFYNEALKCGIEKAVDILLQKYD